MRPIDADALLKRVDEEREFLKARMIFGAEHILVHNFRELINNAPTVEITDYDTGYQDGLEDGLNDIRPQGEWKLVSDINNDIDIVCPFCNKRRIICYAHGYSIEEVKSQLQEVNNLPNYCENCGARMKDGAEC